MMDSNKCPILHTILGYIMLHHKIQCSSKNKDACPWWAAGKRPGWIVIWGKSLDVFELSAVGVGEAGQMREHKGKKHWTPQRRAARVESHKGCFDSINYGNKMMLTC